VRRDLLEACKRAGIERCSPNDLRRTYGRWMRIAAFPDEIIAPTMGHADTRMLERVYGKLSPEEFTRRLLLHMRAALPDCIANASAEPKSTEFPDRLDTLEPQTLRNWCPGAESNHRNGNFQSTSVRPRGKTRLVTIAARLREKGERRVRSQNITATSGMLPSDQLPVAILCCPTQAITPKMACHDLVNRSKIDELARNHPSSALCVGHPPNVSENLLHRRVL